MGENVLTVNNRAPHLADFTWIAPTATVVGDVVIGPGTDTFYGAVVRADMEAVTVGENSNVQDTAVIHADPGYPARIGDHVSIGHGAVLPGCTVEDGSLIGMNATVLNGAVIGAGSLVAANALVLEGTVVPPRSLLAGVPARVHRELTQAEVGHCRANAATYETLTTQHAHATPATIGQHA